MQCVTRSFFFSLSVLRDGEAHARRVSFHFFCEGSNSFFFLHFVAGIVWSIMAAKSLVCVL